MFDVSVSSLLLIQGATEEATLSEEEEEGEAASPAPAAAVASREEISKVIKVGTLRLLVVGVVRGQSGSSTPNAQHCAKLVCVAAGSYPSSR